MTDARTEPLDLDAIEAAAKEHLRFRETYSEPYALYFVTLEEVLALVAEVRRLRAERVQFLSKLSDTFANTMVELEAGPIENGWHKEYHRFVVDMLKWIQREQHTPHSRPGRLVNTTRHRDVTLETWERPNESDGGE